MSILIKGMEMPEGCYCCPLAHRNYNLEEDMTQLACYAKDRWGSDDGEKPDWCPLIEIPPHGELVDRDEFITFIKNRLNSYYQWIIEMIEECPTVIPADKDGET